MVCSAICPTCSATSASCNRAVSEGACFRPHSVQTGASVASQTRRSPPVLLVVRPHRAQQQGEVAGTDCKSSRHMESPSRTRQLLPSQGSPRLEIVPGIRTTYRLKPVAKFTLPIADCSSCGLPCLLSAINAARPWDHTVGPPASPAYRTKQATGVVRAGPSATRTIRNPQSGGPLHENP
jgi:hypothetical protein